jgi:uncharacterized sodium:solute symporter family permease YidK
MPEALKGFYVRPEPHLIDYTIILLYFVFVLGIGFALKKYMKTSTDFFLSGRSIPAWIAGLAFLSANLGAPEVIGMGASGAKYGISTSHFYWIGAVPAMLFVGVFMMPFYYGSRARSVPEYLKLRGARLATTEGGAMAFDIRMPIGMLFTLFGILLIGYGAATRGSSMYEEHSLGLNMNVWWGGALVAF